MSTLDLDRAALVLADALALGDKGAAKKWGIHVATVERYRARSKTDPQLRALVDEKRKSVEQDLAVMRVEFLRDALRTMRAKLPDASLYEVSGAVKIVGELHQLALEVEDERDESPDHADPEEPGAAAHGPH